MSLQQQQLSALAQMGIPVWQLRSSEPASTELAAPSSESLVLNSASNCLLFAGQEQLPAVQHKLLAAMLRAINLDLSQLTWIETSYVDAVRDYRGEQVVMIVCGNELAAQIGLTAEPIQHLNRDILAAVIPDINAMLSQPEYKAEAWQTLRQIQQQVKLRA